MLEKVSSHLLIKSWNQKQRWQRSTMLQRCQFYSFIYKSIMAISVYMLHFLKKVKWHGIQGLLYQIQLWFRKIFQKRLYFSSVRHLFTCFIQYIEYQNPKNMQPTSSSQDLFTRPISFPLVLFSDQQAKIYSLFHLKSFFRW